MLPYIEIQIDEITHDELHKAVIQMLVHQQIIVKQGRQEIMRIMRVPSGWIYETPSGRLFGGRNATFVPLP